VVDVAVGAGKFKLFSKIDPVLSAGDYRYIATQTLDGDGTTSMPIETHNSHVRVRAPRYQLPPDQVLSTFPPAGSEGSFGSRLPQIVIKRRTLPWERDLDGQDSAVPWLALVLIAEGEAELRLNEPVESCVTAGVTLSGTADTALGSTLVVRRSIVHAVFPTRIDVPLLAHAREVDINDTELMMGDDDGFLSVVIANRLPLGGRDAEGNDQPVKYLACLVNLEGQFDKLLPTSPPSRVRTALPLVDARVFLSTADHDMQQMNADPNVLSSISGAVSGAVSGLVVDPQAESIGPGSAPSSGGAPRAFAGTSLGQVGEAMIVNTGTMAFSGDSTWTLDDAENAATTVYAEMAVEFASTAYINAELVDPTWRFPVLLHWSFVSSGAMTFESLMNGLDSGLIGTVDPDAVTPPGREPLEVVETGHVGLVHRTRRGDQVRSWYRGPLVPHPPDATEERLALAHSADQLRTIIPDGREDLSLASAFEIGRLLALSHPSMIAAMLQWRQTNYHLARRGAIWGDRREFLDEIVGIGAIDELVVGLGVELGRGFIRKLTADPDAVIGGPRPLVDPGRPLVWDRDVAEVVATGFGLQRDAFAGDLGATLDRLQRLDRLPGETLDVKFSTAEVREQLHHVVDQRLVDLVSGTLDLQLDLDIGIGPGVIDGGVIGGGVIGGIDGLVIDRDIFGPTVPGTVMRPGGVRPFEERFAPFARASDRDENHDPDADPEEDEP
jgi:hypothetical protein